jgi:ATP-dependent DNA helicase RecG
MQLHDVAGSDLGERHIPQHLANLTPELRLVVLPRPFVLPGVGEVLLVGEVGQSGHAPPPVPLVSVLEQVFTFIQRNTPSRSRFLPGQLAREEQSGYPPEAIREGLVNAFAHRDYADFRGGIAVHVYPDRLEIWNSGSLPDGMSPDDLVKGHVSVLRNPDIAHVLYLRGMMEKLGRGCVMIRKACEKQGLRLPEWLSGATGVTLTFFAMEVTTEVTTEVRAVLSALTGTMTRQELQDKLGLKNAEHFRKHYLVPAVDGGFLAMTIPGKPKSRMQRYQATEKGRRALVQGGDAA